MSNNLNFFNIDRFCSTVNFREERPILDLSSIDFIYPFALVYLGLFIRLYNRKGKRFRIKLPQKSDLKDYLEKQNFFERFNIAATDSRPFLEFDPDRYSVEMVDIRNDLDLSDSMAEKISILLYNISKSKNADIPITDFCEISVELVDNFVLHSKEDTGVMMIQYYPKPKLITMAIGDCGIGIRDSLSENPKFGYLKTRPHNEAIRAAIELGASRFEGRGTGFYEVMNKIEKRRGNFSLVSFGGYLRIAEEEKKFGNMCHDLPGVQIEFSLPE